MGPRRSAKNFCAVTHGREIGVFTEWPLCSDSVTGFAQAKFKGCTTYAEAKSVMVASGLPQFRVFYGERSANSDTYEIEQESGPPDAIDQIQDGDEDDGADGDAVLSVHDLESTSECTNHDEDGEGNTTITNTEHYDTKAKQVPAPSPEHDASSNEAAGPTRGEQVTIDNNSTSKCNTDKSEAVLISGCNLDDNSDRVVHSNSSTQTDFPKPPDNNSQQNKMDSAEIKNIVSAVQNIETVLVKLSSGMTSLQLMRNDLSALASRSDEAFNSIFAQLNHVQTDIIIMSKFDKNGEAMTALGEKVDTCVEASGKTQVDMCTIMTNAAENTSSISRAQDSLHTSMQTQFSNLETILSDVQISSDEAFQTLSDKVEQSAALPVNMESVELIANAVYNTLLPSIDYTSPKHPAKTTSPRPSVNFEHTNPFGLLASMSEADAPSTPPIAQTGDLVTMDRTGVDKNRDQTGKSREQTGENRELSDDRDRADVNRMQSDDRDRAGVNKMHSDDRDRAGVNKMHSDDRDRAGVNKMQSDDRDRAVVNKMQSVDRDRAGVNKMQSVDRDRAGVNKMQSGQRDRAGVNRMQSDQRDRAGLNRMQSDQRDRAGVNKMQSDDRDRAGVNRERSGDRWNRGRTGYRDITEWRDDRENRNQEMVNTADRGNRQLIDNRGHERQKTVIFGSSIPKGVHPARLGHSTDSYVKMVRAAKIEDVHVPSAEGAPTIVIHSGINNLKDGDSPETCIVKYLQVVRDLKHHNPHSDILISQLTPVGDRHLDNLRVLVNALLITKAADHDFACINNDNLAQRGQLVERFYQRDGLHLSQEGTSILASNLRQAIVQVIAHQAQNNPRQKEWESRSDDHSVCSAEDDPRSTIRRRYVDKHQIRRDTRDNSWERFDRRLTRPNSPREYNQPTDYRNNYRGADWESPDKQDYPGRPYDDRAYRDAWTPYDWNKRGYRSSRSVSRERRPSQRSPERY
jgi:hypothetical protein